MASNTIAGTTTDQKTLLGADELILNMGPQHPSTHGVLRVKLKLDGERVIGSECMIGYLHRDRKSTRLNSSHGYISYAVFCLKKKKKTLTYIPAEQGHAHPGAHATRAHCGGRSLHRPHHVYPGHHRQPCQRRLSIINSQLRLT